MKQTIITLTAVLFMTANVLAADGIEIPMDGKTGKTGKIEPIENVKIENKVKMAKAVIKKAPIKVKNVWKDMPGYDRFGNEINEKARKNFRENAELNNEKK